MPRRHEFHRGDLNRALRLLGAAVLELETAEHKALSAVGDGTMGLGDAHTIMHALILARESFLKLKDLRDLRMEGIPFTIPDRENGAA